MTRGSRQAREPPRFVDLGFSACRIQRLAEGIKADFQACLAGRPENETTICRGPMTLGCLSVHERDFTPIFHASAVPKQLQILYCKLIRIKGKRWASLGGPVLDSFGSASCCAEQIGFFISNASVHDLAHAIYAEFWGAANERD